MEIWKDVPGFDGDYQASSLGRVRSRKRTSSPRKLDGWKILRQNKSVWGYWMVVLNKDSKSFMYSVHRTVLESFVGKRPEGMVACHNNGDQEDNRIENLRWDTRVNNEEDKKRHGTYQVGDKASNRKLSEAEVAKIKRRLIRGEHTTVIAKEYDVTAACISLIKNGHNWKAVHPVSESYQFRSNLIGQKI